MCGIAGFTTFGAAAYDREALIRAMTLAIAYRGPDGEGYFHDPGIALGHRRLSVIDFAGGAQPMADSQDRYQLLYNGEVYNYPELREGLERRGLAFKTRSDTEVVLESLALKGPAALADFNGMFAIALWDRQRRSLLLARDRMGMKPLFYFRRGADLVFASELKALRRHPDVPRELDLQSVSKYFTYGYIPAPHSIFQGVFKVEAGYYLEMDAAGMTTRAYWDIPLADNPVSGGNLDECCEEVENLLRNSVRRQLRSDVPVGVFLSGGVDSSAVAALAAQESPGKIHTFSIGFDEPSYDESRYAARVASLYDTVHHEETLTIPGAAALFQEVMLSLDEPLADASLIPTWFLSQLASRHVKVVLGGDGSDELFCGYPSFQAHKVVEGLSFLPIACRDGLGRIARRFPVSHRYASIDYLLRQLLKGLGMSPEVRFLLWMGFYGNPEKKLLFSGDLQRASSCPGVFDDIFRYVRRSGLTDTFQRLQYLCMKLYFQDGILAKVDRASMAHSLEARVPYMDVPLVEYACRIQPFYKLHGLTPKYVLKRAVERLLPPEIIHRRKAGFMMPVASWLTNSMRGTIEDICSPGALLDTGLFNAVYVRQMLDEHFERRCDHRKHIYPLLCFMAWLRNNPGVG